MSVFTSQVQGSGFFYDQTFGIEGSWMAVLINVIACIIIIAVGRYYLQKQKG